MFVFLRSGQNVEKGKRRTLKDKMGKNVREFWFSAGVVMSRFVTMRKKNVTIRDNVVETTKPGCQVKYLDSTPILMRYKVRFTFENYRYSIKYL